MLRRFPAIRPYASHRLKVDEPHELYIEECGDPNGIPVLVVHGGPGAGSNPEQRRLFDPDVYRIILFDQRGCGQSTPNGCLDNNNTQALISDMEAIRQYLKVDKWVLYGGAWGAALALIYAETYPDTVSGLVLRSISLANQQGLDWFFKEGGASRFYPHYWDEFAGILPPSERNNVIAAYYERLNDPNELIQMRAAKAWSLWHRRCATMNPLPNPSAYTTGTMRVARLECHYLMNNYFIEDDYIIKNINKISNKPLIMVHGRFDTISTIDQAYRLEQVWRNAELDIVRDAGHASSEPGLAEAVTKATEKMASLVGAPTPKLRPRA